MTEAAEKVSAAEACASITEVRALADFSYDNTEVGAPIASGSFLSMGMVVAPCSIKSLSGIVHCTSQSLLTRTADVILKERRRLVLLIRETPLHLGHLRLLTDVTQYGAVVLPLSQPSITSPGRSMTSSIRRSERFSTSSGWSTICSNAGRENTIPGE